MLSWVGWARSPPVQMALQAKSSSYPLSTIHHPLFTIHYPLIPDRLACHQSKIPIAVEGKNTAVKTILVVGDGVRLLPK